MDEGLRHHTTNQIWRVKVYLLNASGNWEDCGDGNLEIVKDVTAGEEMDFLRVTANEESSKNNPNPPAPELLKKLKGDVTNEKCILHRPIFKHNQYEKQSDSIISWFDNEIQEEIAISFLNFSVFKEVWRTVCHVTGRSVNDERKSQDTDQLVIPTIENLEQIRNDLETHKNWMIYSIIENKTFLDKLYQVFQDLEDLESFEHLHTICEIIRLLIFSEDVTLLELLLSDEYYLLVFGALEYEVDIYRSVRPKYRDFLKNQAFYKKVIDFKDEEILQKIRLNFRISYLKDSVISSIVDDPLSNQFNQISYFTNLAIFQHIANNDQYIDQLFGLLNTNLKESIGFLYELIQILKQLINSDKKVDFSKKLISKNIFGAISKSFKALYSSSHPEHIEEDKKNILKIDLVDVLLYFIQFAFNDFVNFLKVSPDSKLMIEGLNNNLFYGDQGLQIQTLELLKFVIDPNQEKKNEVQDIFYDNFLPAFIEHYKKLEKNEKFYSFVQQLIEILIYCLKFYKNRFRHYIITHKLLNKLYAGFQLNEKSLSLALVRLLKNTVLSQDEFLIKYVCNNNLLDDIFELYAKNAQRDNLMTAACLDFFGILVKENIKMLIIAFVERFRERINQLGLQEKFEKMLIKYEQITDEFSIEASQETKDAQNGAKLQIGTPSREAYQNFTPMERESLEEEEYFANEDDDEPENKDKNGNGTGSEKINDENTPVADRQPNHHSLLAEEELKPSKDSFQRMKDKMAAKKLEDEQDNQFVFGSKPKSLPSPSLGTISIQLNLPSFDGGKGIGGGIESLNVKRPGCDLTADEEINGNKELEPQKKIKLG